LKDILRREKMNIFLIISISYESKLRILFPFSGGCEGAPVKKNLREFGTECACVVVHQYTVFQLEYKEF
jgi:hypothetical protein